MKFVKLKPSDTTVDHRYQRDLDANRAEYMAANFDPDVVGVPVVSKRADGGLVRIDGQHRLAAAVAAGFGDEPILMQVFDGLTIQQEADLFLRLNGNRKGVAAVEKYKARIEAREPVALEIYGVLKKHGCRIATGQGRGIIAAVAAVEHAYNKGNLDSVIYVLSAWMDRDTAGFEGAFVRGVSLFLSLYPDADLDLLVKKLGTATPRQLLTKMRNETRQSTPNEGSVYVLIEIYNHKTPRSRRVLGMSQQAVQLASRASTTPSSTCRSARRCSLS